MHYFISKGTSFNKYKIKVNLLFVFLFIFMWLLFAGNTGTADYNSYKNMYDTIGFSQDIFSVEIGYTLFALISHRIGLDYNGFLFLFSLVGLGLISSTIKKFTKKPAFTLFLYFIYPFLIDIAQIRNFMAMSIVIFGVRYLIDIGQNKNLIKYIVTIVIATFFHKTSIFYLLLLLVKIKNKKRLFFISSLITITGMLLQGLLPNIIYYLFSEDRYSTYFSSNIGNLGKALLIFYFLLNFILVYFSYIRINKLNSNSLDIDFSDMVLKINIIIIIVLIFAFININFIRLFRNILPLNYILYANVMNKGKITMNPNYFLHSIIMLVFILASNYGFIVLPNFDNVIVPIFTRNLFFN